MCPWGKKVSEYRGHDASHAKLGLVRDRERALCKWPFIDFKKLLSVVNSCCAWGRLDTGGSLVRRREQSSPSRERTRSPRSPCGRFWMLVEAPPAVRAPVRVDKGCTYSTDSRCCRPLLPSCICQEIPAKMRTVTSTLSSCVLVNL